MSLYRAAPAGVVRAAPRGVVRAAPAGVVRAAPAGVVRAAPAGVIKAAPARAQPALPAAGGVAKPMDGRARAQAAMKARAEAKKAAAAAAPGGASDTASPAVPAAAVPAQSAQADKIAAMKARTKAAMVAKAASAEKTAAAASASPPAASGAPEPAAAPFPVAVDTQTRKDAATGALQEKLAAAVAERVATAAEAPPPASAPVPQAAESPSTPADAAVDKRKAALAAAAKKRMAEKKIKKEEDVRRPSLDCLSPVPPHTHLIFRLEPKRFITTKSACCPRRHSRRGLRPTPQLRRQRRRPWPRRRQRNQNRSQQRCRFRWWLHLWRTRWPLLQRLRPTRLRRQLLPEVSEEAALFLCCRVVAACPSLSLIFASFKRVWPLLRRLRRGSRERCRRDDGSTGGGLRQATPADKPCASPGRRHAFGRVLAAWRCAAAARPCCMSVHLPVCLCLGLTHRRALSNSAPSWADPENRKKPLFLPVAVAQPRCLCSSRCCFADKMGTANDGLEFEIAYGTKRSAWRNVRLPQRPFSGRGATLTSVPFVLSSSRSDWHTLLEWHSQPHCAEPSSGHSSRTTRPRRRRKPTAPWCGQRRSPALPRAKGTSRKFGCGPKLI